MNRIDYLISEIRRGEEVLIEDSLNDDSHERVESMILKGMKDDAPIVIKRKRRKRRFVWILAATLLMALGLTAYAAKEREWDIALINFMGISNANTLQMENGVVEINQGQKVMCVDYGQQGQAREVEMRAVSSIGDKNEVYVRIETDYVLPEDFNPETDYVLPEDFRLFVSQNESGYGATFTYFEENQRLGFLLAISNCPEVNKAEISLCMENLYLYHDLEGDADAEKELLCEGTWELNWKYHYQSNTKTRHMLHPFEADGITYYLTKVEVSPISIRLEAFRMPWNRDAVHDEAWLEEIRFSNGTVLKPDGQSGSGMRNGMFAEEYIGVETLGNGIDSESVECLVIGDEKIYLY